MHLVEIKHHLSWFQIKSMSSPRAAGASNLSYTNSEKDLYMRNLVSRFAKDEQGAALVEYGMLVGLIAVVCIAAVRTLGVTISGVFATINVDLAGV
jgi:pilus assembly protein Flp/PilA